MAFLGDLLIRLRTNTADFVGDMGKAAYETERSMKRMTRAAKDFNGMLTLLGTTVSVGAFAYAIKRTIDAGDQMNKVSQRIGISTQSLSELAYAAQLADVPLDSLEKGVKTLSQNMAQGAMGLVTYQRYFKDLGISYQTSTGQLRPVEAVLGDLAEKFASMEDGTKKTALAALLLGRSGLQLIPMLNAGRDGIAALRDEARRLGITWSQEAAKAAEDFNDNLTRLEKQWDALLIQGVGSVLPMLIAIQKALLDANSSTGSLHDSLRQIASSDKGDWFANLADDLGLVADSFNIVLALGSKFVITLKDMADGMAAFAAQSAAIAHLDFEGARTIGAAREEQYKKYEAQFNAADAALKNPTKYRDMFSGFVKNYRMDQQYAAATPGDITEPLSLSFLNKGGGVGIGNEMEAKKYSGALQALEQQLGKLNGATQEQITLYQTTKGSLADLSDEHKKHLLDVARQVDVYLQAKQAAKEWVSALDELEKQQEQADQSIADFNTSNSQYVQDLEFQSSLLTKGADEQRRLTEMRKIDLETQQRLAALGENATTDQIAQIYAQGEAQRQAVNQAMSNQLAIQRDWRTGAIAANDEYMRAAQDMAAQTHKLWTDTYQGLEDALVNFVKTGKLSFKDLADSIIEDIIRIQVKKFEANTLAPLIDTGLSALAGIFGFAEGGIVPGALGQAQLAVVHGGEAVLTPEQQATVASGAGGVTLVQNIQVDARSDIASVRAAARAGGQQALAALKRDFKSGGEMARAVGKV